MNRLVLIGNGFDLAHGLKTGYQDFINWYWEQRLNSLLTNNTPVSQDCLCELKIKNTEEWSNWFVLFLYDEKLRNRLKGSWNYTPLEILNIFKENTDMISVTCTKFLETILQSIETKNWVDIENEYYRLLKNHFQNPNCGYKIESLNNQMKLLREKLIEYLKTQKNESRIENLNGKMCDKFKIDDFSPSNLDKAKENISQQKNEYPENIMFLSFNYTPTVELYLTRGQLCNYIHGEIKRPDNIIFGYGDELDEDYKHILDSQENGYLENSKSIKYLETGNYRDLLRFIESGPFQVFIIGHSCGSSDRTLLNTIFEHSNCMSIKPFYHRKEDGTDNYIEIAQNIARNFTDMKLFRDRVVNKEQCLIF